MLKLQKSGTSSVCYWWGRFFVRSAHVFAGLLLVVSVVGFVARLLLLRSSLTAATYVPGAQLNDDMTTVASSCRRTADLLSACFASGVVPDQPPLEFPALISGERGLEQAAKALESHGDYVQKLQQGMMSRFSESSNWLVGSMGRKAKKVRQSIEQQHGRETEGLQGRIARLRGQLRQDDEGVFLPLDQADYQDRVDALDDALDFLEYLGTLSDSAAVQSRIDAAVGSLGRMRDLLPVPTPESRRLRVAAQVAELRRKVATLLRQGEKLEGEQLAGRLRDFGQAVATAMRTSWRIERDMEILRERLKSESAALVEAQHKRRSLATNGLLQALGLLGGGGALAFLLLVIGDVFKALFDSAAALESARIPTPAADGSPMPDGDSPAEDGEWVAAPGGMAGEMAAAETAAENESG